MSLTSHLVIQKEVKLYHQGKLLHCKWNGQSEAWDVGNVSWHGGLTMCPLGSDWMCSRNSFYWEAELGPNTSLPFIGSMQVSKTTQRCTCVSLSVVSNSVTPWTVACQASLFITSSWNLLKLVHWVGDVIQPSHPLLSPSPALNLSQHQDLFHWVSSSHQVAKVLEFQLQHQSFEYTFRTDLL